MLERLVFVAIQACEKYQASDEYDPPCHCPPIKWVRAPTGPSRFRPPLPARADGWAIDHRKTKTRHIFQSNL